jgi:hypothetical protein
MDSYRHPGAQWLGTPNFTPDRQGHDMSQPSWIVIHTMVGTVASANARFQQASEQASATYGIGLDGKLYQWVDEKDAAWANGTFAVNPGSNLDSISIEHEDGGRYNDVRPDTLYAASAALVRDICTRYGIPIDRAHIIGHRECANAATACPDALDIDRIVAEAAGDTDLTPEEHAALMAVRDSVDAQWDFAVQGTDSGHGSPGTVVSLLAQIPKIAADVAALKQPAIDAAAVATALATNTAFLDAVAARTVALLGAKASA